MHKIVLGRSEMTLSLVLFQFLHLPCLHLSPVLGSLMERCCALYPPMSTAVQAPGGPSPPQSPWEFASAVGSPHENRFVIGMEELGEPLGFPSRCVDWGMGAMREEAASELVVPGDKGLGLVLRCRSCEALVELQCLGLKHPLYLRTKNRTRRTRTAFGAGFCLC